MNTEYQMTINTMINDFNFLVKEVINIEERFFRERLDADISAYSKIMNKFSDFEIPLIEKLKEEIPYYNLFSILKIRHYETKVHTPFLANLLDPKGTHGHNSLFFNAFIQKIDNEKFLEIDISSVKIKQEERTVHGQVDMIIRFRVKNQNCAIVIENKIYHQDEDKQLERYKEKLEVEMRIPKEYYHLVYLTLDGRQPSNKSISEELLNDLKEERAISCFSYRTDIFNMLCDCQKDMKSETLKHIIFQYLQTIKSL